MHVGHLYLIESPRQVDEIGHVVPVPDGLTQAVNECLLMVHLCVGDIVDLSLYDAKLLKVFRVLTYLPHLVDVFVYLLN